MNWRYTYQAQVDRVVDGDTVDLIVDLGFCTRFADRFRLAGIDASETRGFGKEMGLKAKAALQEKLATGAVTVQTIRDERGKYGRWLAILFVDKVNVNEWLVEEGFAQRSFG